MPDGKTLLFCINGHVRLFRVDTMRQERAIYVPGLTGHNLTFTDDGKTLVTADLRVAVWDVATRQSRTPVENAWKPQVCCVEFAADGKTVISSGWDGTLRWRDSRHRPATSTIGAIGSERFIARRFPRITKTRHREVNEILDTIGKISVRDASTGKTAAGSHRQSLWLANVRGIPDVLSQRPAVDLSLGVEKAHRLGFGRPKETGGNPLQSPSASAILRRRKSVRVVPVKSMSLIRIRSTADRLIVRDYPSRTGIEQRFPTTAAEAFPARSPFLPMEKQLSAPS